MNPFDGRRSIFPSPAGETRGRMKLSKNQYGCLPAGRRTHLWQSVTFAEAMTVRHNLLVETMICGIRTPKNTLIYGHLAKALLCFRNLQKQRNICRVVSQGKRSSRSESTKQPLPADYFLSMMRTQSPPSVWCSTDD